MAQEASLLSPPDGESATCSAQGANRNARSSGWTVVLHEGGSDMMLLCPPRCSNITRCGENCYVIGWREGDGAYLCDSRKRFGGAEDNLSFGCKGL